MSTMKNLIVFYDENEKFTTKLEDIPIPKPIQPTDILIKVTVAGANPKDWKHPMPAYFNNRLNQGDDCCGTVAAMGPAVRGFEIGDRVAGFHEMDTPNGTYAEYTLCPAHTVFHIPDTMSDEEAATFPLALFTSAVGLYRNLGLPAPWDRSDERAAGEKKIPLVINGAGSATGAFAVKLAKLNPRIGPIIATAGSSADYVRSLGVDAVVDYRSPTAVEDIKKAAAGKPINHVYDTSNTVASVRYLSAVLNPNGGRYTCTSGGMKAPSPDHGGVSQLDLLNAAGVWYEQIWVGEVHGTPLISIHQGTELNPGGQLFGAVMSRAVEEVLTAGKLRGHPFQVVKGGLEGVEEALLELKNRKTSGNAKFVVRIADTPGLQK